MAGAGFKTFNTGDVLTASDVNTYLMQQTVMVFADSSARSTALGANVAEGMLSYLKDTDQVEVYNGSAWVSSDDPNAIQNAIVDAKGDIITATAADTPARLAVGSNGYTLVADSSQTTGLGWAGNVAAGKNAIINGGFDIWQRSTSAATSTGTYPAPDRWWAYTNSGSATFARESTVIPSGALYAGKITATANNTQVFFSQVIETANIVPFINKTVTVSGQLAASTTVAHTLLVQYSTIVDDSNSGSWTTISASTTSGSLTPTSTTYVSFANTYAIPSNAKSVRVGIQPTSTIANGVVCYYGNFQLELGSSATPFSRNGSSIQGELAACQRYYYRSTPGTTFGTVGYGLAVSTTVARMATELPVEMRVRPTSVEYGNLRLSDREAVNSAVSALTLATNDTSTKIAATDVTSSSLTQWRFTYLTNNNNTAGYLGFSAEL